MDLKEYFSLRTGTGVLATADTEGRVDTAIYASPLVAEDGTLTMIMRDRLSHKNLQENPYANYLFIENIPGYKGIRLFLKKIREDNDPELIKQMTRRCLSEEEDLAKGPKFIVYFQVEKQLDLLGSGEI